MKYTAIKISEEFHKELKTFCEKENLKLNKWCEEKLKSELLYTREYSKIKKLQKTNENIGNLSNNEHNQS